MATETQKKPLTALAWALQYIEDDHHEDLANDAYARDVLYRAREALDRVFSLVAAAEALNDDPDTLLELEAALVPFQVTP